MEYRLRYEIVGVRTVVDIASVKRDAVSGKSQTYYLDQLVLENVIELPKAMAHLCFHQNL